MGGAHSIPTDPSRTIQVIGAGYSRTGTVSMKLALTKLLDGPVIHGGTQILEGSEGEFEHFGVHPIYSLSNRRQSAPLPISYFLHT